MWFMAASAAGGWGMRKIGMMRSAAVILISAMSVSMRACGRCCGNVGDLVGQLVPTGTKLLGLGLETSEARGEVVLIERAVLERVEVPVDGLVGLAPIMALAHPREIEEFSARIRTFRTRR